MAALAAILHALAVICSSILQTNTRHPTTINGKQFLPFLCRHCANRCSPFNLLPLPTQDSRFSVYAPQSASPPMAFHFQMPSSITSYILTPPSFPQGTRHFKQYFKSFKAIPFPGESSCCFNTLDRNTCPYILILSKSHW